MRRRESLWGRSSSRPSVFRLTLEVLAPQAVAHASTPSLSTRCRIARSPWFIAAGQMPHASSTDQPLRYEPRRAAVVVGRSA